MGREEGRNGEGVGLEEKGSDRLEALQKWESGLIEVIVDRFVGVRVRWSGQERRKRRGMRKTKGGGSIAFEDLAGM